MLLVRIYIGLCRLFSKIGLPICGAILYVGGGDTLPPPLEKEAEQKLMCQLEDPAMRSGARAKLIEHNLRLVVYISRRFENTGVGIEDLVSIGTIGLIKAVENYQPSKNIKLATFASKCIENEILMYLRKNTNRRCEVSLDEPLNTDWDGNELLLSDILGTEPDLIEKPVEQSEERALLLNAVARLSDRERTIITLRFGLEGKREKTQKEVADMLGISQSYISRLEKRIINRLKKEIISQV